MENNTQNQTRGVGGLEVGIFSDEATCVCVCVREGVCVCLWTSDGFELHTDGFFFVLLMKT